LSLKLSWKQREGLSLFPPYPRKLSEDWYYLKAERKLAPETTRRRILRELLMLGVIVNLAPNPRCPWETRDTAEPSLQRHPDGPDVPEDLD